MKGRSSARGLRIPSFFDKGPANSNPLITPNRPKQQKRSYGQLERGVIVVKDDEHLDIFERVVLRGEAVPGAHPGFSGRG